MWVQKLQPYSPVGRGGSKCSPLTTRTLRSIVTIQSNLKVPIEKNSNEYMEQFMANSNKLDAKGRVQGISLYLRKNLLKVPILDRLR